MVIETYDANGVNTLKPRVRLLSLFDDEFIETHRTALLHAFEAETHVHRQSLLKLGMRFKHVDPTQNRALVIG